MTRAAIYARVSSDEQALKGTIETQLDALDRYIAFKEWEVVERFLDDGVSGTIALGDRPAGARLLEAVRQKTVDVVLVYKVDRLGRKMKVAVDAVDTIEKAGVGFVSAQENFDTTTSFGKAGLGMSMVFAQLDRDRIVENTTNGRYRRVKNGKQQLGPCNYGYTYSKETGQLEVKEDEAAVVRHIFDLALAGHGMTAIAHQLDKAGVPVPNANHPKRKSTLGWQPATVHKMLTNERYIGRSRYGAEVTTCPAIVSEPTFVAANKAREEHKWNSPRNGKHFYMLKGMLRCGVCGGNYMVVTHRYPRYECLRRGVHGPKAGHSGVKWAWRADELDEQVKVKVAALYEDPQGTLERWQVWAERMQEDITAQGREVAEVGKRLAALDDKERRFVDLAGEGHITGQELAEKRVEVARERARLQEQLQAKAEIARERDITLEAVTAVSEILGHSPGRLVWGDEDTGEEIEPTPEMWRDRIGSLISHIVVKPDGNLTYHLNPSSSSMTL